MTERELLDLLARDVAEALTAIADREGCWAGVTRSFASSIYARHARPVEPPTPPADADDAAESLLWILGGNEVSGYSVTRVLDLVREVIRQRDEARREAAHQADLVERGNQYTHSVERQRDDAWREAKAAHALERERRESEQRHIARADAAEKERDEARRAVDVQLAYSVELQRIIEALKRGEVYESTTATHHVDMAREIVARADAAEATVRELREMCGEAADHITPTAYVHTAKLAARLRAAAAQPATEGRADG